MIAMIVVLAVVALLLVWLSLSMAATEGAVGRVTRASLNNLILEIQTDAELSQFIRDKKIRRIHKVQRLVADRYATAGSCAFFRICCNVVDGVLVTVIAGMLDAPLWAELLAGFVFAIVIAVISLLVRPRSAGASKPVDIMLQHVDAVSIAVLLTPFAKIGGQKGAKRRGSDLSDDEELEKIQIEQGRATIDRLVEANDFDPEVSEMLRNVLTLSETLTREIMVPRTDMICIERDETLENMLKLCSRSGFSRVPVIGDDVDDLVGVAYLKDAVRATTFNHAAMTREVESIVRDPMLVPESKPVDDLFHQMQRTRQHVAIVVDEYGGIAGMVTIEDAIEQIVGELEDEHDRTQHADPERIGDKKWSMPARTPIADLEEIFEIDIDEDDVDTVYGLLTKLLGRVPRSTPQDAAKKCRPLWWSRPTSRAWTKLKHVTKNMRMMPKRHPTTIRIPKTSMTDAATTETTSDHSDSATPVPYRSGFVAVVGRPNVGKSTLINALIGTQIAIASSRPETTRKAIRGILTTDNAQIVLVDTPGIHRPRTLLGQRLNDVVDESLADVDAVAFLLPSNQEIGPGDKRILSRLRSDFAVKRDDGTFKWKVPLVAIVTKIDELSRDGLINKLIEINEFADFTDIVPVSALKHDNLAEVKNVLIENMPEGPQMYPAEQITEERPEETIAELVRGAFLEELDDELPHSLAVVVDSIEYPEDNDSGEAYDGKAHVIVSIYVERDSQKPIIIGKGAEHLVRVKKKLRTPVNRIVGQKAKLDLHVKVAKGWQSDPKQLEKLGF